VLGGFSLTFRYFFHPTNFATESKKLISYVGSFVLGSIVEKLSNENFLAVVDNVIKDLVDGDQEDVNVLAVVGTIVEDLVDGNQEDANKWFECNNGNVVTSIAVTLGDEEFNQEDAIKTDNNDDGDGLMCSGFSNLPLPFSGVIFFGTKGFPFFSVTFVVFLCAFGMNLFFLWVCVLVPKCANSHYL
jgi:hypothetical protein